MGNNAVVCLWIRGTSEMVKKFQLCLKEEGCNVVGGFYSSYVILLCFRDCCIICLCS